MFFLLFYHSFMTAVAERMVCHGKFVPAAKAMRLRCKSYAFTQ